MRTRLVLAAALLGALSMLLPSALAAPATPTLDGKKVKTLTIKGNGGLQSNVDNPAPEVCAAPRCMLLPFVYNPAKGVKGDVMFTVTWESLAADMDLYVVEVGKSGNTDIGHCASVTTTGAHEKYFMPAGTMKKGKTYGLAVDFYRSVNDNVVGTVEMPAANSVATSVPSNVDSIGAINCTL